jgi:hypothetical protein
MKGERERGNSVKGSWGKRKRGRGVSAKQPPLPSSPTSCHSEAGGSGRGGSRAATAGRPPGHGGGRREGKKEEGDEGVDSTHSPWVEAARGGGLAAAADRWCWPTAVARCGRAARQWRVAVAWWCGEDGAGLFIAGARSVRGEIFVHTGAPARSAPASSSSFAGRRPVAGQLVPVRRRGAVDKTGRAGGELALGRMEVTGRRGTDGRDASRRPAARRSAVACWGGGSCRLEGVRRRGCVQARGP